MRSFWIFNFCQILLGWLNHGIWDVSDVQQTCMCFLITSCMLYALLISSFWLCGSSHTATNVFLNTCKWCARAKKFPYTLRKSLRCFHLHITSLVLALMCYLCKLQNFCCCKDNYEIILIFVTVPVLFWSGGGGVHFDSHSYPHFNSKEQCLYLIIVFQQDVTYSVYYISVDSSTCFGCWHPSSGARTTVITASGID